MLELLSFERRRSLVTDTSLVPRLPGGLTRRSLTTVRRGPRLDSVFRSDRFLGEEPVATEPAPFAPHRRSRGPQ
ncbi:hypothetical protein [Sorangium sp. So ce1151]|uniref:hypothetical protein n=1 Tax=Sorangium sp. So ce1151 TaxID=3133332 RepID=UPI003F6334B2